MDMRKLKKLKVSRTGKKGYITKGMNQLNGMVEAGGCSRGEMKRLMNRSVAVYEELENVCEEITDLEILHDVSEDIRFNVDCCVASVTEHLESRQDEAPSSGSQRTSSGLLRTIKWVSMLPAPSSNALEDYESNLDIGSEVSRPNSNRLPDIESGRNSDHVDLNDIFREPPRSGVMSTGPSDIACARNLELHSDISVTDVPKFLEETGSLPLETGDDVGHLFAIFRIFLRILLNPLCRLIRRD